MSKLGRLLVLPLLLVAETTLAQTFEGDMEYLRHAVDFSEGNLRTLRTFMDVSQGAADTMLPEANAPWAGNYFPMTEGGIANRWQDSGYPLRILTERQVKKLTPAELAKLSAIEKYDIFVGDYTFSATKYELSRRGPKRRPKPEEWEGFCNGARCAGGLLPEPRVPITVLNPDGLQIAFEPADLKGLASASYFYVEKYAQLGAPSSRSADTQPNAAIFDLALRYYVGELKKPFVIDGHLGDEIWNQSVVGYTRNVRVEAPATAIEKGRVRGAVKRLEIEVNLKVLGEVSIQRSNTPTKAAVSSGEVTEVIPVRYILFVDANNKILGGEWDNYDNMDGVDFVWFGGGRGTDAIVEGKGNSNLQFNVIDKLFKKAAKNSCLAIFK